MIDRYKTEEMANIWSKQAKFQAMLEVELAVLKANVKLGIIPELDYDTIKKNIKFSVAKIQEIEMETKHDVIAFVQNISESLGPEKRWIHYGLTSTDVVDTANALLIKKSNVIIEKRLNTLKEVLKTKAIQYETTPCIGRTHGMHADITSFGLKWALWFADIQRNLKRFKATRIEMESGKISGAVGNYVNSMPAVQDLTMEVLKLNSEPISTQVIQRDKHAHYFSVLALIASCIEKMAVEIRHLQRTEISEVEEYFSNKQKGSSAMPHKRNPIASENVCGCARVMRSYMQSAYENISLWHERDISHSSVERIIIPDALMLLDYMLKRYTNVLNTLLVYPDNMLQNINKTKGVVFSQKVMSQLIKKGMNRQEAYEIVQSLAMKALKSNTDFLMILLKSPVCEVLRTDEIIECFNINKFLIYTKDIYMRIGIL